MQKIKWPAFSLLLFLITPLSGQQSQGEEGDPKPLSYDTIGFVQIGFGKIPENHVSMALGVVSDTEFNNGIIASPEQLITGRIAGVQMTSSSGLPGDGIHLRIRGVNSFSSSPLFVVDGIPLAGGKQPLRTDVGLGSSDDLNRLIFINPEDIESITVLKDAGATAIYGSRGASGVVIIQTKNGSGPGEFSFKSSVSISQTSGRYDLLNSNEYLAAIDRYGGNSASLDFGSTTDWQDYITRTGISNNQQLSYSKSFKTGALRVSGGYEDQQGIIQNSFMKRYSGRINGYKSFFNNSLNVSLTSALSSVQREDPPITGNAGYQGDLIGSSYAANPTWPIDADLATSGQRNPANMLKNYYSEGHSTRILTSLSMDYKIIKELTAKAAYGLDHSTAENVTLLSGAILNGPNGVQGSGLGQLSTWGSDNHLLQLTLDHSKKYGILEVIALAGYSIQKFENGNMQASARGFSDPQNMDAIESELRNSVSSGERSASSYPGIYNNWGVSDQLQGGSQQSGGFVSGVNGSLYQEYYSRPVAVEVNAIAANYYSEKNYIQSYFARTHFLLSQKYILSGTVRYDGSSKFGSANRYTLFPSIAIGWKLHEEGFLPDWINAFKVRASYGLVGNESGIGHEEFKRRERWAEAFVNDNQSVNIPGTSAVLGNPELKVETSEHLNGGLDFMILANRLRGSFDLYTIKTKDLVLKRSGFLGRVTENLDALVKNRGWEFSLESTIYQSEKTAVTLNGNLSHNDNKVKNFSGSAQSGQLSGVPNSGMLTQVFTSGYSMFTYFLREFEGFDANGQPIGDEYVILKKSALPKWNYGFSVTATFSRFDVGCNLAGQGEFYLYNNTQNTFFTASSIANARNVTSDVLNTNEAAFAEPAPSTRFLEKGDFLRVQCLEVGYSLPLEGESLIQSLRISLAGQNLFLFTDYSGPDPEVSSSPARYALSSEVQNIGIDMAAHPRPKTVTLRLSVSL